MKRLLAALVISYFLIGSASAASIQTFINVTNGSTSLNQSVNNGTLEIFVETNGSAVISTNVSDEGINFSVNASGEGSVKVNGSGKEGMIVSEVDDLRKKHTFQEIFSAVFEFFRGIFLFGWVMT